MKETSCKFQSLFVSPSYRSRLRKILMQILTTLGRPPFLALYWGYWWIRTPPSFRRRRKRHLTVPGAYTSPGSRTAAANSKHRRSWQAAITTRTHRFARPSMLKNDTSVPGFLMLILCLPASIQHPPPHEGNQENTKPQEGGHTNQHLIWRGAKTTSKPKKAEAPNTHPHMKGAKTISRAN